MTNPSSSFSVSATPFEASAESIATVLSDLGEQATVELIEAVRLALRFDVERLPVGDVPGAALRVMAKDALGVVEAFEDGEVLGLDDRWIVQWNKAEAKPYTAGESLYAFGHQNLREHELARVGVSRERWIEALANARLDARSQLIDGLSRDQSDDTSLLRRILREGFEGFQNMSNADLVQCAHDADLPKRDSHVAHHVAVLEWPMPAKTLDSGSPARVNVVNATPVTVAMHSRHSGEFAVGQVRELFLAALRTKEPVLIVAPKLYHDVWSTVISGLNGNAELAQAKEQLILTDPREMLRDAPSFLARARVMVLDEMDQAMTVKLVELATTCPEHEVWMRADRSLYVLEPQLLERMTAVARLQLDGGAARLPVARADASVVAPVSAAELGALASQQVSGPAL